MLMLAKENKIGKIYRKISCRVIMDDLELGSIFCDRITSKLINECKQGNSENSTTSSSRFAFRTTGQRNNAKNPNQTEDKTKYTEIESGIEILEEPILTPSAASDLYSRHNDKVNDVNYKRKQNNIKEHNPRFKSSYEYQRSMRIIENSPMHNPDTSAIAADNEICFEGHRQNQLSRSRLLYTYFEHIWKILQLMPFILTAILIMTLPLPEFLCGVLTSLFGISVFTYVIGYVWKIIEREHFQTKVNENFLTNEFNSESIRQIQGVLEHKQLRSHAGWMNQISNYDPNNYHMSMTRSVYVILNGSKLTISETIIRVPKRYMWNENIDRTKLIFNSDKCFDLKGCRIEMCPKGLAKKRFFSRKYPIQLIVKNSNESTPYDSNKKTRYTTSSNEISSPLCTPLDNVDELKMNNPIHQNEGRGQTTDHLDFGNTVLHSNLQKLQDNLYTPFSSKQDVPHGDETRILLFARCDREKEDWYRRFLEASLFEADGSEVEMSENEHVLPNHAHSGNDMQHPYIVRRQCINLVATSSREAECREETVEKPNDYFDDFMPCTDENPTNFVKFMTTQQQSVQNNIVWANVLVRRILFGCLNDRVILRKVQDFSQRKLNAIKLPSFMENVIISQLHLGDTSPVIHRVLQPQSNERGVWISTDISYEGLAHMTMTAKLNLLRLRRQQNQSSDCGESSQNPTSVGSSVFYDSNAESTGGSSTDSEGATAGDTDANLESQTFCVTQDRSKRILHIVNRITASNLFQSATEISYIQRAMENMTTKITLRVELKRLSSCILVNIPPPPSDRIWIAFREPPRLWITAKPTVGDHTVDWNLITNVIESKLCDEINKYIVYPNMVDVVVPFLGQPDYKE